MNIVVCAIAKNEHLYVNEWVKHYLNLGFNRIYIFDNDEVDSEPITNFIDKDYLDRVTIFNKRGVHQQRLQNACYKEFYDNYCNTFDWCLFCDLDEFLDGFSSIYEIISPKQHTNIEQIRIKWKLFGDDDIIERDTSKPVFGFFKKVILNNKLSNQGKSIIRGHIKNIVFNSVHYAHKDNKVMLKSCLPSGAPCKSEVEIKENYDKETIYLNHYMTKTLDEFVKQKMKRGTDACFEKRQINLDYFWKINSKTKEKLNWLNYNLKQC